jgi:hypothetical protein
MSWLDDDFFFYDIDKLFLFEIDDDFISRAEFIQECKNIVIVSFCPWEI